MRWARLVAAMARGFESKDVEYQQAEAERVTPRGHELTPRQRDEEGKRKTAELALLRARADLALARSPAHRLMLEHAIAALEQLLKMAAPS